MRKASKIDYQQNSARISFASYHVAKHEDPAKTSLLLGHQNPSLLWETYRALVSKDAAEKYWKITPGYDGSDLVGKGLTTEEIRKAKIRRLQAVIART